MFSTAYNMTLTEAHFCPLYALELRCLSLGVKLLNTLLDEGGFAWPKKEADTVKLLEIVMSFFVI